MLDHTQAEHRAFTVSLIFFKSSPKGTLDDLCSSEALDLSERRMPNKLLLCPSKAIFFTLYPKYVHRFDRVSAKRRQSTPLLIELLVELDQILRVNLIAVKNNINLWVGHIVHAAIIEVGEAGILGRWSAVHGMSDCVFSNNHSG